MKKIINQHGVRGREEEKLTLFYQAAWLHIPAGSYVLSLRHLKKSDTGPCLCQTYPIHSFISCFINIFLILFSYLRL